MKLHLLCIGTRMPAWVELGYQEYASRMPKGCSLCLREFPVAKRSRSGPSVQQVEQEGQRLIAAIPANAFVVSLDVKGNHWDTIKLSNNLARWLGSGRDVAFLIGGPDGLSQACGSRSDYKWSLSSLTFPHGLARVIVTEQIYRAWSILQNHPYHRG